MYITPSHLLEYLYCPRFTYYEYVLQIPQKEEKRHKVELGKHVHQFRETTNLKYLRKKLGVLRKESEVELNLLDLHIRGKVDELLWLDDGTMAPFDYKFAEYKERIWKSVRVQETLYAIMIKEIYKVDVKKAFLCFTRSKSKIVTLYLNEKDFQFAIKSVEDCIAVIQTGYYPAPTKIKERCKDCTYKNLCVH